LITDQIKQIAALSIWRMSAPHFHNTSPFFYYLMAMPLCKCNSVRAFFLSFLFFFLHSFTRLNDHLNGKCPIISTHNYPHIVAITQAAFQFGHPLAFIDFRATFF